MLIKVIDQKGKTIWVNPTYINGLREYRGGKCQFNVSGWGMIVVNEPADDVAGSINLALHAEASMLSKSGNPEAQIAERAQAEIAQQQAMITAIVIGG